MTAFRSCGVKSKWRSGDQLCSALEIKSRHSSMACCVKQFHGFEEVTGSCGIMDLKIGEVTGDDEACEDRDGLEWYWPLLLLLLWRAGLAGASGEGGLRAALVSGKAKKALGPATDRGLEDNKPPLSLGRMSIRAPACNNSLKTSLLPRATAT